MDIMKHFYLQLPGWFSCQVLYNDIIRSSIDGSHFVEVGSYEGQSAAYMAVEIINSKKKIKFDCIDTWANHNDIRDTNEVYQRFLNNMNLVIDYINPIRMDSVSASKLYNDNSLDFVYIDADHSYESVKDDIISWLPKVKPGGILAGHDYPMVSVREAVHDVLGEKNISVNMCSWRFAKKVDKFLI